MTFQSLAPVIHAEKIEECASFWTDRLGFQSVAEVQHGENLGFIVLVRDQVTVMYQSYASVEAEAPGLVPWGQKPGVGLFIQVTDFDALLQSLEGVEVVVEERKTAYTSREIVVRAPCGTVVGFALEPQAPAGAE